MVCLVDVHPEPFIMWVPQVCGVYGAGAAAACVPRGPGHVVVEPRGLLPWGAQSHSLPAAAKVLEGPGGMGGRREGGRKGGREGAIRDNGPAIRDRGRVGARDRLTGAHVLSA